MEKVRPMTKNKFVRSDSPADGLLFDQLAKYVGFGELKDGKAGIIRLFNLRDRSQGQMDRWNNPIPVDDKFRERAIGAGFKQGDVDAFLSLTPPERIKLREYVNTK